MKFSCKNCQCCPASQAESSFWKNNSPDNSQCRPWWQNSPNAQQANNFVIWIRTVSVWQNLVKQQTDPWRYRQCVCVCVVCFFCNWEIKTTKKKKKTGSILKSLTLLWVCDRFLWKPIYTRLITLKNTSLNGHQRLCFVFCTSELPTMITAMTNYYFAFYLVQGLGTTLFLPEICNFVIVTVLKLTNTKKAFEKKNTKHAEVSLPYFLNVLLRWKATHKKCVYTWGYYHLRRHDWNIRLLRPTILAMLFYSLSTNSSVLSLETFKRNNRWARWFRRSICNCSIAVDPKHQK